MRDAGAQVRPDHATARRSEGDAPSRCLGNGRKRSISAAPLQNTRQTDLVGSLGLKSDRLLASHGEALRHVVARKMLVLGLQRFSVDDLTRAQAAGEKLQIRVLGLASIADDVPAQLAADTIESITVLGALHASPAVRAALAGRIT